MSETISAMDCVAKCPIRRQLEESLAEAQKDAARYRWLRSYDRVHAEDDPWVVCWADPAHTANGFVPIHGEELDAFIDEAMK